MEQTIANTGLRKLSSDKFISNESQKSKFKMQKRHFSTRGAIHNSIGRQPRAALALAVAQGLPKTRHVSRMVFIMLEQERQEHLKILLRRFLPV